MGRLAGQHAESRAALAPCAGRGGKAVDVGAPLARAALGGLATTPMSSKSATSRSSRWGGIRTTPRVACGPSDWPSSCTPIWTVRARPTARSCARSGSGTSSDTPPRRAPSQFAGRVRERRPSGPLLLPRSAQLTHAASSPGATSTSSRRPPLTGSPAGPGSRGVRQPRHSPRSQDPFCQSDRHSATSGCSRRTRRPCGPRKLSPHPRACCRAAMRTSCSTERSGSFSCRGRISGSGSGRPAFGQAPSSPRGEIRGTWRRAQHTVRIDAWTRLPRRTRDAIEAEARALPLPVEREIGVAWSP
jgi:hypothetical protein